MSDRLLGHYRLLHRLGQGGMAEVYAAEDRVLGRRVALKILPREWNTDAQRRARLRREARALAALDHPGIVSVHSVEQFEDRHFITMELVEGESLQERIPAGGLPLERFFTIGLQLTAALAAAHAKGIVHRDLKPSNVMLSAGDDVKILDFGLATAPEADEDAPPDDAEAPTLDGMLIGTAPYMAPEQAEGRPADPRSDIYSLGAVLYEMATGERPHKGSNVAQLLTSILRDPPPVPDVLRPELPHRLGRLLLRCLEKNPGRRPQSATELEEALRSIRGSGARKESAVRSLGVLPFVDMSPSRDQDYFCEGIAAELIDALTRVEGLRVASRSATFQFFGSGRSVVEIGRALELDAVVDGSVRKAGDRLRITAELVSVEDGYDLWSKSFSRDLRDVFAIQDEITSEIVEALQVTLSPSAANAVEKLGTRIVDAYDYYLKGRQYFYQCRRHSMEFAIELFSRAIELDPGYAPAWAGIADCSSYLYANAERRREHLERALDASSRAIELNPNLATSHVARAVALSYGDRGAEAEASFKAAIDRDPRSFEAHYFYARHSFVYGNPERAIAHYARAAELSPEDYQALLLSAQTYDDLGRAEEASAIRREGVRRAEDRLRLAPHETRALYMAANGLILLGEQERALELARRARELDPEEPMLLYNLACVYSLAGQVEPSVDCLEACMRHGFSYRDWLEHDSNLDRIRDHPRFLKLMERFEAVHSSVLH